MTFPKLNSTGFLFTQTSVAVALLKASFGDGYSAAARVGAPSGLRSWAIRIDVLPDSSDQGAPLLEGRTRADYLWTFFLTSKSQANSLFWLEDPKDGAFYLAEFADDELSYEIFCAKVYGAGLQLTQRRAQGVVSPTAGIGAALTDLAAAPATTSAIILSAFSAAPMAHYAVERKTGAGGIYAVVATAVTLPYTDTGLATATAYYYRVRQNEGEPVNAFGPYSNEAHSETLFDPVNMPGLLALWDVGRITGLSNLALISTWPDASPALRHATQTSTARLAYITDAGGGVPAVRGLGQETDLLNHFMSFAEVTTVRTVIAVVKHAHGASPYNQGGGDTLIGHHTNFDLAGGPGVNIWYPGASNISAVRLAAKNFPTASAPHYVQRPIVFSLLIVKLSTGQALDQIFADRSAYGWQGDIRLLGLLDRDLTPAELANLEAWVAANNYVQGDFANLPGQILFVGDSLTRGWFNLKGTDYPSAVIRSLYPNFEGINHGWDGSTMGMIDTATGPIDGYLDLRRPQNVAVLWCICNTLSDAGGTSFTAATAHAAYKTWCDARKAAGWPIVLVLNCIPRKDATAMGIAGFETKRQNFNALLAADHSFADGLVDLTADPAFDTLNDADNLTYYDADKEHLTPAGYARIAALVTAKISALP